MTYIDLMYYVGSGKLEACQIVGYSMIQKNKHFACLTNVEESYRITFFTPGK